MSAPSRPLRLFTFATLVLAGCGEALRSAQSEAQTPWAAKTVQPVPGAPGIGDPYYPLLGNGGYDVEHYDLVLAVDMDTGVLRGTATITALALVDLSSFNLDLHALEPESIEVNEASADFEHEDRELTVLPGEPLSAGTRFETRVVYGGVPELAPDPAIPILPGVGWVRSPSGIYVLSECTGAASWFPCNDHPLDKATFSFTVTVKEPYVVAANGTLVEERDLGTDRTFVFRPRDPMATYLATVNIAEFTVTRAQGPGGIPLSTYHPRDASEEELAHFARTGEMLAFFGECFGPYPFECFGAVISYEGLPGALETQTIPVYGRGCTEPVLAHEMAHQWFGDCVSPAAWKHMWLNEGFASYGEFLWFEHVNGKEAADARVKESYRRLRKGKVGPPADPGVEQVFTGRVYGRGSWVLHALRREVGDEVFFAILKRWVESHRFGNATTEEFVATCEEVSGRELDAFLEALLHDPLIPEIPEFEVEPEAEPGASAPRSDG